MNPYLSFAALAHAAALAAVALVRAPVPSPASDSPPTGDPAFDLDEPPEPATLTERPPARIPSQVPLRPLASALHSGATFGSVSVAGSEHAPEPASAAESLGTPAAGPAPSSAPDGRDWVFTLTKPVDVAAPAVVAQAARDVARDTASHTPGQSPGGLREALDGRDAAAGLGRGGPVLSALESASRSLDVPIEGSATFDVAIDTSGHVSVSLTEVAKDFEAWSRVARAASTTIDPKRMAIPQGARGWHVAVHVDAGMQYPDGTRPGQLGTRAEGPPGQVSKSSMVRQKAPALRLSARRSMCGDTVPVGPPLPGVNCAFSTENAGMPGVRIVTGHIVNEGQL